MPQSPDFRKRLNRAIKLFLREMVDGCIDCTDRGRMDCDTHKLVGFILATKPSQLIKITEKGIEWTDEGNKILGIEQTQRYLEGGTEPSRTT